MLGRPPDLRPFILAVVGMPSSTISVSLSLVGRGSLTVGSPSLQTDSVRSF